MADRSWWYDERLRVIREAGMALDQRLNMAALNLRQAVKYSEPPDDMMAEECMQEMAEIYAALALNQMQHVTLRRAIRQAAEEQR